MSQYVNFEIKPNLPVLGKRYGKLIPKIKAELGSMNQMDLAQRINRGDDVTVTIDGEEIVLNQDNLLVTMKGLEGYAFAGEGELGVILDTNLTVELKEEGDERELISKIQNLRKESNFEVADKIELYVTGNEKLEGIIRKFEDHLKKETLTVAVHYNEAFETQEFNINGETIQLGVKVVR